MILQNLRKTAKANIQTHNERKHQSNFSNLLKNLLENEITNQKEMREDFMVTVALSFSSEEKQQMMLYFDRNITYFENQLKNLI